MRVKVSEIIALGEGLSEVEEAQVGGFRPAAWIVASILVASIHCDAGAVRRVFGIQQGTVDDVRRSRLLNPAVETAAEALHRAVVNLKAARRRAAEMCRWRALQTPVPIVRGPWRPAEIKRGPRPYNPPKSFWNVETAAPVGVETHAA